jgi:succinylglutamic semialdehyde dehydrogenase
VGPVEFLGDYIDGRFTKPDRSDGEFKSVSPGDLTDVISNIEYRHEHIGRATKAAREAFPAWARLPQEARFSLLRKLKDVYTAHADQLTEMIARETGKPKWDSASEAKAMIAKIDVTLDHSMRLVKQERITNALPESTV